MLADGHGWANCPDPTTTDSPAPELAPPPPEPPAAICCSMRSAAWTSAISSVILSASARRESCVAWISVRSLSARSICSAATFSCSEYSS